MGNSQVKLSSETVPPSHIAESSRSVFNTFRPVFYKAFGQQILQNAIDNALSEREQRKEEEKSSGNQNENEVESFDALLNRAVHNVWGDRRSQYWGTSKKSVFHTDGKAEGKEARSSLKQLQHRISADNGELSDDSSGDTALDERQSASSRKHTRTAGDISGRAPPPPPASTRNMSNITANYSASGRTSTVAHGENQEKTAHSSSTTSGRHSSGQMTKDQVYSYLDDAAFRENRRRLHAARWSSIEKPLPPGLRFAEAQPLAKELCRGWMKKLGYRKENWKYRFFIALNQQENYTIYYFEDESHGMNPTKCKGYICPCGYSVRILNSENEILKYGSNCLSLCDRYHRRTWYLKCSTSKEMQVWYGVFKYACCRAQPELLSEDSIVAAFLDSYWRVRSNFGFWGYYMIDRCEEEQLILLAVEKLERGLLAPLLDQVAVTDEDGETKKGIISTVFQIAGKQIRSKWTEVSNFASYSEGILEELCRNNLGYICFRQKKLYGYISNLIRDNLKGPMNKSLDSIVPNIVKALRLPVYMTLCEAIKAFKRRSLAIVYSKVTDESVRLFEREICCKHGDFQDVFRFIRYFTRGEIIDLDEPYRQADVKSEALEVLHEMPLSLPDLLEQLQGISLWEIETILETSIQQIGLAALSKLLEKIGDEEDTSHGLRELDNVVKDAYHDGAVRMWWDISLIASQAVYNSVTPLLRSVESIKTVQGFSALNCRINPYFLNEGQSMKRVENFLKGKQRQNPLTASNEWREKTEGLPAIPSQSDISDFFLDTDWALIDILYACIHERTFPLVRRKCLKQLRALLELSDRSTDDSVDVMG